MGSAEYVELYNPTPEPVTLWDVETGSGWRLDGGIDYVFSPEAAIPALGYMVIVPFEPNEVNLNLFKSAVWNPAIVDSGAL